MGASAALLLYRIARPSGHFLGRVRLRPETEEGNSEPLTHRDVYIPVQPDGVRNPLVKVDAPPPGIIIYRFDEAFVSFFFFLENFSLSLSKDCFTDSAYFL